MHHYATWPSDLRARLQALDRGEDVPDDDPDAVIAPDPTAEALGDRNAVLAALAHGPRE